MVFCDTHCQYYNVVVVFSGRSYTVYCLGYLVTTKHHLYNISLRYVMVIAGILYIVGLGLFEAIAIQFGLDQLLEAPTHQLVSFIHWYYWSQNIGSFMIWDCSLLESVTLSFWNCTWRIFSVQLSSFLLLQLLRFSSSYASATLCDIQKAIVCTFFHHRSIQVEKCGTSSPLPTCLFIASAQYKTFVDKSNVMF